MHIKSNVPDSNPALFLNETKMLPSYNFAWRFLLRTRPQLRKMPENDFETFWENKTAENSAQLRKMEEKAPSRPGSRPLLAN